MTLCGTDDYMAPEIQWGEVRDSRGTRRNKEEIGGIGGNKMN